MGKQLYYLATTKPSKLKGGISYKIYKQLSLFEQNGYVTHFVFIQDKTKIFDKLLSCFPLCSFRTGFNNLNKFNSNSDFYVRYFLSDYRFIKQLKSIKKLNPKNKIGVEIPTFPYDGENQKYKPSFCKDLLWRTELKKYVDRIITFSDDNSIFGVPTIRISNGVDLSKIKIRNPLKTNTINLLAVAQFGFWHGYDRLIEGLHRYYTEQNNNRNIKFYVVGYGNKKVENQYKELIHQYNLQDHVILTGRKTGRELDYYYNICDIGIDSMGRHRSKVYYNSSLKGKEYLAKGLPIVSGVKTELDSMPDFPYYFRVPANDSPINIVKLLNFYDFVYKNKSKKKISIFIRNFCKKNFDMDKCFEKVINWYKQS